VQELDARIHFALNCGAESCPPIAFYEVENIDAQLELATTGFLQGSTKYDLDNNEVTVSRILSWYRGDFGGKKGIVTWLQKYKVIGDKVNPKVKFAPYNWSAKPKDYEE